MARNKGLSIAKGEYIVFIDADDWVANDIFIKSIKYICDSKADVVLFDYFLTNGEVCQKCDKVIEYGIYLKENISIILRNMFAGGKYFSSIWRGIYKREIIENHRIEFPGVKFAEDLLFNIEYLFNCDRAVVVEDTLYFYFDNENSSLKKLKNNIKEIEKIPMLLYQLLQRYNKYEEYSKELEIEILYSIDRIFNSNLRYNGFIKEIKEFYENYSDMLLELEYKQKLLNCL